MRPATWPAQPTEPPKPTPRRQGCFQVVATILGLLIGIAGLIIAVIQINPPPPPPPPTTAAKPPQEPGQVPTGRIVFSDDFDVRSSAWSWCKTDNAEVFHQPGEMRIIVKRSNRFQSARLWPGGRALRFQDARVDVEITSLGEPDALASILCRYQGYDDYYRFAINSDGTYEISKLRADRWRSLVPRRAAPELNQERLRIQVACIGDPRSEPVRLMLWAGGKGLAAVTDRERPLPPGEVAIGAGTYQGNDFADVAFTRFAVRKVTG
jgi:hypothetical protein